MRIDLARLVGLRHWLHAHPEISRHETATADHLRRFLQEHARPDRILGLAGAGFAAVYDGVAPGRTVMIRCELDALPIQEANDDLPHRSLSDGISHKCGHDGHMTILAGLAQTLAERPATGRVVLMFQPDEETGSGARECCSHESFARIRPDHVFALHNLPGFPEGQVICRAGAFSSQVKYAAIRLTGREAHSAQPETGASPSFALAELMLKARDIQAYHNRPDSYALCVPVFSQMGVQASGICPARGEVHVTLRAPDGPTVEAMWADLTAFARTTAGQYGLDAVFETREEFAATANGRDSFEMIRQAAAGLGLEFNHMERPFRWGEDFGEFTSRHEGAMFGLGAGLGQARPAQSGL
ncbi:amidohydrolase [Hoeflea marina]|uniref:amidohydrolase n=1 Tax=Hoeflea marina TaxID=274592 RepID=UPI001304C86D|nr:amidohydrolase [Hoeflea marina]